MLQNKDNSKVLEGVLDKYQSLYKAEYRPRHHRALICFGIVRYTELAELAIKKGKHAGRLMSTLLSTEFEKYHTDRLNSEVAEKLKALKPSKAVKVVLAKERREAVAFIKQNSWLEKGGV